LIFAIINISPLIWIQLYYNKHDSLSNDKQIDKDNITRVVADFKVSDRELEIIGLIIEGKSNKEIEDKLNISVNTVKNHIYNIYKKLGVNSRSQLIRFVNSYNRV
jgi:DNA-binding CsgD family transcriptional regulator